MTMEIRKVPASAGAEWLLEAFRLLKKSPLGFGLLAVIYAGLWLSVVLVASIAPDMAKALQLLFIVIGPLLMAGMIFAAHEVSEGRSAAPVHLLASIRTGKAGRILTTLIPQFAVLFLVFGLLFVMVGQDNIDKLSALMLKIQAQAETGAQIDPQVFLDLPTGRLFLWMILAIGIGFLSLFLTLTVVPDMLFTDVRLLPAMKRSFTACLRNLPALIVFMVITFVILFAVGIGAGIAIGIAQLVLGNTATLVGNALINGFFICFIAGAMYFAWKQMLGGDGSTSGTIEPSGVAM
jgi:hypothetical protein